MGKRAPAVGLSAIGIGGGRPTEIAMDEIDTRHVEVAELLADEFGHHRARAFACEYLEHIIDFPTAEDAAEWVAIRERHRAC